MATINGIFSTKLRGKVGDVVYRVNGQKNTVSQKPSSVTNPKSMAQQLQRMYMSTAAIAYSQMKAICDHSFEGFSGKQGNQAEFLRRNVRFLAGQNSAFNFKGNQYMMPNDFTISRGSLNSISLEEIRPYIGAVGKTLENQTTFNIQGTILVTREFSKLVTGGPLGDVDIKPLGYVGPKVKDFCDAFGINVGSQLTFVLNYVPRNYSVFEFENSQQLETRFKYCRLVLKASNADKPLLVPVTTEDGTENTGIKMLMFDEANVDKEKSLGWDNIRIIADPNSDWYSLIYVNYDQAFESDSYEFVGNNVCASIITSEFVNGSWKRSSNKLTIWTGDELGNRDNVVRSYSPNDPKYLNNADK